LIEPNRALNVQVKAGGNEGARFDVAEEAEAQADGLEELDAQREREQVPVLLILLRSKRGAR
jgi:hypothetical protein